MLQLATILLGKIIYNFDPIDSLQPGNPVSVILVIIITLNNSFSLFKTHWPLGVVEVSLHVSFRPHIKKQYLWYWFVVSGNKSSPEHCCQGAYQMSTIQAFSPWSLSFNPLHAKFFRVNINIYLQFMSFLCIDMTQVLKIVPQVR